MALDIKRLRKAVEWAEKEAAREEEGNWNQGSWAEGTVAGEIDMKNGWDVDIIEVDCGTSFCIAGYVCASEGDRFVVTSEPGYRYSPGRKVSVDDVLPKGYDQVVSIEDRALALLGIDSDMIEVEEDGKIWDERLFYGDNSIEDVRRIAAAIAAEHGHEL